jgi:hypothetical protein
VSLRVMAGFWRRHGMARMGDSGVIKKTGNG